jgi:hypothetical protein
VLIAYGGRAEGQLGVALCVEELGRHDVWTEPVVSDVEALDPHGAVQLDAVGTRGEGRVNLGEAGAEGRYPHVLDLDANR